MLKKLLFGLVLLTSTLFAEKFILHDNKFLCTEKIKWIQDINCYRYQLFNIDSHRETSLDKIRWFLYLKAKNILPDTVENYTLIKNIKGVLPRYTDINVKQDFVHYYETKYSGIGPYYKNSKNDIVFSFDLKKAIKFKENDVIWSSAAREGWIWYFDGKWFIANESKKYNTPGEVSSFIENLIIKIKEEKKKHLLQVKEEKTKQDAWASY